jgi:hypothetical protein
MNNNILEIGDMVRFNGSVPHYANERYFILNGLITGKSYRIENIGESYNGYWYRIKYNEYDYVWVPIESFNVDVKEIYGLR